MFTARDGETKYRFVASRTLLNEVCGETAPEKARKAWVKTHLTDILDVRLGASPAPFNRVHVEELT